MFSLLGCNIQRTFLTLLQLWFHNNDHLDFCGFCAIQVSEGEEALPSNENDCEGSTLSMM